jgi:hypothetical protein
LLDTGSTLLPTLAVTIFTQYFIRIYRRKWYDRYNYITSAALDLAALLVAVLLSIIFEFSPEFNPIPNYILKPDQSMFGPDYCGIPH